MTQRYNEYLPAEKKAKYRIINIDGEFFPQRKFLWFWRYFKTILPCSSDIIYDRVKFDTREEAAQYIRDDVIHKLKRKNQKTDRKVVSYFDDTGFEF